MSSTQILEQIRNLPDAERREVVERIQVEDSEFDDELTPGQIAELDRRAERAVAHPELCRPLEDVIADVEKRFRERQ